MCSILGSHGTSPLARCIPPIPLTLKTLAAEPGFQCPPPLTEFISLVHSENDRVRNLKSDLAEFKQKFSCRTGTAQAAFLESWKGWTGRTGRLPRQLPDGEPHRISSVL